MPCRAMLSQAVVSGDTVRPPCCRGLELGDAKALLVRQHICKQCINSAPGRRSALGARGSGCGAGLPPRAYNPVLFWRAAYSALQQAVVNAVMPCCHTAMDWG
jgi:hypothetical protein